MLERTILATRIATMFRRRYQPRSVVTFKDTNDAVMREMRDLSSELKALMVCMAMYFLPQKRLIHIKRSIRVRKRNITDACADYLIFAMNMRPQFVMSNDDPKKMQLQGNFLISVKKHI